MKIKMNNTKTTKSGSYLSNCLYETLKAHTTLWHELTREGAPKPNGSDCWWNDWAANNPQPQAKALAQLDPSDSLMKSIKGITTGARPINY